MTIFAIQQITGVYRWEEGHQVAEYTNWYPTGPHNVDTNNCVWKAYQRGHPGWHDVPCSWYNHGQGFGEQHALCQVSK